MTRNVTDGCIFCAPAPCSCNTRAKKGTLSSRPARPPATPTPPVAEQPTVQQAQRAGLSAVKRNTEPPKPKLKPVPVIQQAVSQEEEDLRRAVTIIANAGLLDEKEMRKHRNLIDLPEVRIKAIVWRQNLGKNKSA